MSRPDTRTILQTDKLPDGRTLSRQEREELLKPYLPPTRLEQSPLGFSPQSASTVRSHKPQVQSRTAFPPRGLVNLLIYKLLYFLVQLFFSVYIRSRQIYRAICDRVFAILFHHHRSPELIRRDVRNLGKLPRHLSVIVELKATNSREAVEALMREVAELAAWCACAGIGMLSVYERTGALKTSIPELHETTLNTFTSYFSRQHRPTVHITTPEGSAYSPAPSSSSSPSHSPLLDGNAESINRRTHLNILLMSAIDGRDTLVDLTKTLAEMAQNGRLKASDVTTELIHAEIEEGSGCGEPDLLVVMSPGRSDNYKPKRTGMVKRRKSSTMIVEKDTAASPRWAGYGICLHGYPPWQVRLTEIFHVQDSSGIGYQLFLRALHRYAKAELRFGR